MGNAGDVGIEREKGEVKDGCTPGSWIWKGGGGQRCLRGLNERAGRGGRTQRRGKEVSGESKERSRPGAHGEGCGASY